jgi:hypothetical protein
MYSRNYFTAPIRPLIPLANNIFTLIPKDHKFAAWQRFGNNYRKEDD